MTEIQRYKEYVYEMSTESAVACQNENEMDQVCPNKPAVRRMGNPQRPALMPQESVLDLHNTYESYRTFNDFHQHLERLLEQGELLEEVVHVSMTVGIIEPFTGKHIAPENIDVSGTNYRESLVGNDLLSRNRGILMVLEKLYGSLGELRNKDIYLLEALSGFAMWLKREIGNDRLICSEYQEFAENKLLDVPHQDLCALTFADASFDLVLCSEVYEHVQDLEKAFRETARVLRPGGMLVATCPLAFGQIEGIVKARHNPKSGNTEHFVEAEFHGDPVRPKTGSLVYRIPGWDVLDQLRQAGFTEAYLDHVVSWKHGVIGSDLPGVLVIKAMR